MVPTPESDPHGRRVAHDELASEASRFEIGTERLEHVFRLKYGTELDPRGAPWRIRRHAYYTPDEHYEALMSFLIEPGSSWLDVGCGRSPFPDNPGLAQLLALRAGHFAGLDPDDAIDDNPFLIERFKIPLHELGAVARFDVVSLRMVAEHIEDPPSSVNAIARATRPGGLVVIYTVHRHSLSAIAAALIPHRFHAAIARRMWGTAELNWGADDRDVFIPRYRMNTRRALARLFGPQDLREVHFALIDDCRLLWRWRLLHSIELAVHDLWIRTPVSYPERNMLVVFRKGPPAPEDRDHPGRAEATEATRAR